MVSGCLLTVVKTGYETSSDILFVIDVVCVMGDGGNGSLISRSVK